MVDEAQARAYLEEAELTLASPEAIYREAKRTGKRLWSKVAKEAYDAMENCAAAGLAARKARVPRSHPAKIAAFITEYNVGEIGVRAQTAPYRRPPSASNGF